MTNNKRVWKRLKRNKTALFGLSVILLSGVVALLGYLIMPDDTPLANEMMLQLSTRKPGFSVQILRVRKNEHIKEVSLLSKLLVGQPNPYRLIPVKDYSFTDSTIRVEEFTGIEEGDAPVSEFRLADVVYAVDEQAPISFQGGELFFTGLDGAKERVSAVLLKEEIEQKNIVTQTFYLGTDRYGRDMLSRLISGARVSLSVGFVAVIISLILGTALGSLSGFYRGSVDNVITWLINVVWSLPTLLLVIAISFALGKGFWQVFVAIGLSTWVEVARMVRGQILSIRETQFVEAARALGFSNFRIIFRHILPNIVGALTVVASSNFASAILLEAGLSFLGFGAQPPMASWGGMIKENYGYIIIDAAYLAILPGLAIMLLVFAFTVFSSGLSDALNVKSEVQHV